MSHLDLNGLQRYAQKEKEWADSRFASAADMNWQKTEAAGAVSFSPVPEMPLDPVVNFLFTETGPASGTKGPDNPSTIAGVTQAKVTRCGKNLIPYPYPQSSFVNHGYTATSNDDGSVIFNGESDGLGACHFNLVRTGTFLVKGGISYTAALYGVVNTGVVFQAWGADGRFVFSVWSGGQPATFTPNEDAYITMRVTATQTAGSLTNAAFRPQLELGSAATSFEPYSGADYTVNLGGTFYGGSVDLSTGVMTVTWWGIALNGQNGDFQLHSSSTDEYKNFQWNGVESGLLVGLSNPTFSHFVYDYNLSSVNTYTTYSTGGTIRLKVSASDFPDLASLNAWFATQYSNGTPAVFCAQLAANKRYTVSLTPTQIYSLSQIDPYTPRINTVYSDQTSVHVGYPKSQQATAAELTNAIISLGGNV